MEEILDHEKAASAAKHVLKISGDNLSLDSIIFVGEFPSLNTITTLPSTFPDGDLRYKVWVITQREKKSGKTVAEIVREQKLPKALVHSYYYGSTPYAARSVFSATEEGILPFSYKNPNIDNLNSLFALAFWTGCVTQGIVQVRPNELNKSTLDAILNSLGYSHIENSDRSEQQKKSYTVEKNIYYVLSSALARTFGLLGLPYERGHKAAMATFDIPWYADFMYGRMFFRDGQGFDDASREKVEKFRRAFCYALLSDKTVTANMKNGVSVELMGTYSMEKGTEITRKVATMLMKAFPGLEIPDENLMTTKKGHQRDTYRNRIFLYSGNITPLMEQLRVTSSHDADSRKPLYLQIRELATPALI